VAGENPPGPETSDARIVITHDFMATYGGAERVTQEMAVAFPNAEVVAILGRESIARRMNLEGRWRSLLPARELLLERYRLLTPAFPALLGSVRLPAAEGVLSSSYAFAHHLRTSDAAPQACYCHSPLRFAWSMRDSYRGQWTRSRFSAHAFDMLGDAMRRSDRRAAGRVARYLTQSPFTAEQIRRFYGREAQVIGAPIDCELFRPSGAPPEDYFLVAGRLIEPYKQVSIVLAAFRNLGARLLVAGEGPAAAELRAVAPANVEFLGSVEDRELVELMQRCRAAIFPSRDDFGLTPLEVMSCGRPVLAYGGGGALHTMRPGVTGELFDRQTAEAVEEAMRAFDPEAYDPAAIRAHALRWDKRPFRRRLVAAMRDTLGAREARTG